MKTLLIIGLVLLVSLFGGLWVLLKGDKTKAKRESITRHRIRNQY